MAALEHSRVTIAGAERAVALGFDVDTLHALTQLARAAVKGNPKRYGLTKHAPVLTLHVEPGHDVRVTSPILERFGATLYATAGGVTIDGSRLNARASDGVNVRENGTAAYVGTGRSTRQAEAGDRPTPATDTPAPVSAGAALAARLHALRAARVGAHLGEASAEAGGTCYRRAPSSGSAGTMELLAPWGAHNERRGT